ncbi:MAG: rhodanese-like domain-containing protein [Bacteroidetes bacterium]|nr:MAG: rhodanese-like domain-containing protein [Bacteroidota bacterium]
MKPNNLAFVIFVIAFGMVSCQKQLENPSEMPVSEAIPSVGTLINIDNHQLEMLRAYDKNLILVDVRRKEELDGKYPRLEEAMHLQDSVIFAHPDTLPRGKTIVLMCRSGRRSAAVARMLVERGYTIYNLEKGLRGYYEKGQKPTDEAPLPETKADWESERGC